MQRDHPSAGPSSQPTHASGHQGYSARGQALVGRHIIVTRSSDQAVELAERLEAQGAVVTALATIRILPPHEYGPLDQAISQLEKVDWVLFTSANGVQAFAARLQHLGSDWQALHRARVGAIGPATARELQRLAVPVDLVPTRHIAGGLVEELGNVAGQRILLPCADIARPTLAEQLRLRGADVVAAVAYRTFVEPPDAERVRRALTSPRPDAITFTSSSTVRGFLDGLTAGQLGEPREVLSEITLACIGPVTADALRGFGLVPSVVAEEYTVDGLIHALVQRFSQDEHQPEGVAPR